MDGVVGEEQVEGRVVPPRADLAGVGEAWFADPRRVDAERGERPGDGGGNARALASPLTPAEAWEIVDEWLDAPAVWVPEPGAGHREILGRLVRDLDFRSNLIADAALAAPCIEYGLEMVSADSDFARFTDIRWHNPVAR